TNTRVFRTRRLSLRNFDRIKRAGPRAPGQRRRRHRAETFRETIETSYRIKRSIGHRRFAHEHRVSAGDESGYVHRRAIASGREVENRPGARWRYAWDCLRSDESR